jgi:hypothetical protein
MYNFSYKYKAVIILFIKLLIIFGAFYFISNKISNSEILKNAAFYSHLHTSILSNNLVIVTILLFTITNWLIEIKKWKSLVSSIKNITLLQAFKQSFSSLTASLLTPNKIGEYGAKALYYPVKERKKIMLLNFLGNFSQMNMTVFFGLIGILFLWKKIPMDLNITFFQAFAIAIMAGLLLFFLIKKYWNNSWKKFIQSLYLIPISIHLKNYTFSLLRYIIFSHQFYFLIVVFGVDINYFTIMTVIFSMYLIASVIPSFVIFDWLIKGSVAVSLFGIFGVNEIIILSIISIMWILNFALPSVIGSYYVLIFNKEPLLLKENTIRT